MKKLAIAALLLCSFSAAQAGGILTNTNQSARFARLMALDGTTNIDAAYYNPAGLVKLNDGIHFSISNQSAFQTREITSTFGPFKLNGGNDTKFFEGTASAPIIPSIQAAYKKGNWVLSGNICVIGGGGKATFSRGLPSFEAGISAIGAGTGASQYSLDQYMSGSSFIYGAQMGGTYKINDMFSAYGGFRLNIVNNHYEGYLKNIQYAAGGSLVPGGAYLDGVSAKLTGAGDGLQPFIAGGQGGVTMQQLQAISPTTYTQLKDGLGNPANFDAMTIQTVQGTLYATSDKVLGYKKEVVDRALDTKQSGWGITPIIGLNICLDKLNIGLKYEHKANLNLENKTVDGKDAGMDAYKDGVNTAHDIPALFTIGGTYQVLPQLSANVSYHHFFDSSAKMANDKQKFTGNGTNEYALGLEYKINKMFLISTGAQLTNYGVKDEFQSDMSFSVNSFALGFGGAVNVSEKVQINVGYFWSDYVDYEKKSTNYNKTGMAGTDIFTRTNKVFAAGVEFSF